MPISRDALAQVAATLAAAKVSTSAPADLSNESIVTAFDEIFESLQHKHPLPSEREEARVREEIKARVRSAGKTDSR